MSSGFLHRIEVRYLKETLIDIETYSEVDIGKCGLYRYATDPSFEILLVAWATDEGDGFGETRCADLASGEPLPKELLEDFQSGNVRLIAHNASFERVCFSVHMQRHLPGQYLKPGEFLSPDSWICTMVMAASLTLPMALKDVCKRDTARNHDLSCTGNLVSHNKNPPSICFLCIAAALSRGQQIHLLQSADRLLLWGPNLVQVPAYRAA